jgi:hypothetical protein
MARYRSLRKGKVFKDFKDRREYQPKNNPNDFPDPPHYSIMPEEVRESMKQDMDSLTRQEVEALLRVSKQYLKEYNRQTYS